MSKGITKSCPACKKIAIKYAKLKEEILLIEQRRCASCQSLLEVEYKLEPKIIIKKIDIKKEKE